VWQEKTPLEHAMSFAESSRARLSHFYAGRVLLRAEDPGDSATDPAYWYMKHRYYEAEYWRIYRECQKGMEAPPAAPKASMSTKKAQQSGRRPTTKNIRRRGKKSHQLQPQTTTAPAPTKQARDDPPYAASVTMTAATRMPPRHRSKPT
jgi:hypothetical protein